MKIVKRAIPCMLLSCLSLSINAGTMGSPEPQRMFTPFGSLEGSYSWNKLEGVRINSVLSNNNEDGWGGRAAAGLMLRISDRVSVSGEVGWGYYGSEKVAISALSSSSKFFIYGLDLLVGPTYHLSSLDLFAKAGIMFQTLRINSSISQSQVIPGGSVQGVTQVSSSIAGSLPEIKAGAMYNFNERLGLSVAYMFASGFNNKITTTQSAASGVISVNGQFSSGVTTLNTIFLGLNYNFV